MGRIEQLLQFLTTSPSDCFLKHALAMEYIKIGEERRAQQQLEEVLAINSAYIGSYYHLAKLYERTGSEKEAIRVYEEGMVHAKAAGDLHALSELRSAYEELVY